MEKSTQSAKTANPPAHSPASHALPVALARFRADHALLSYNDDADNTESITRDATFARAIAVANSHQALVEALEELLHAPAGISVLVARAKAKAALALARQ